MKKKSNKLSKLENDRYSILTSDLSTCYICGKPKENLHEVYEGAKRIPSIKYGCILPLCYQCHVRIHYDRELALFYKRIMQAKFIEAYPDINFLDIFHINYL